MKSRIIKLTQKIIVTIICLTFVALPINLNSYALDLGLAYVALDLIKSAYNVLPTLDSVKNFVCNGAHSPFTDWSSCDDRNVDKHKGYKPAVKANDFLEEISEGTSNIRVYGQEKAKEQCLPIVMDSLNNIENAIKGTSERRLAGNVIYVIGPPGTGKTTMVNAIGEAILKDPKKAMLVVDSSHVSNRYPLGDQLFKTIGVKNIGGNEAINEQEKEAPILEHLLKYDGEVVVFIDDFDKLKQLSNPDAGIVNQYEKCENGACESAYGKREDKTADEILKTIAETGEYTVSNTKIDCRKAIFFVATNEKRADLEKNFGVGGVNGGGVQRVDVIEFENLQFEDCYRIAIDIINEVRDELTDVSGNYKLASFLVNDDSIKSLASIIESDKVNQGRLRKFLKRQILSLFTKRLGKEIGNQYEFIYKKVDTNPLYPSNFQRHEISRSIYNIYREENATIPYDGKDIPVVEDVPSCETCKSFLIYNANGVNYSKSNTSPSQIKEDMAKFFLPFINRLPKEIRGETFKKASHLLEKELKAKSYMNKNCLLITVNTKGAHQSYVTLRFAQKELLKKPDGDVYYINYEP